MAVVVQSISAHHTHDLRRAVLRDGVATAVVEFPGDDEPTTFHLGAFEDDDVVGIATFMARSCSNLPDMIGAFQLRGMAVGTNLQSSGVGTSLLRAGIERLQKADVPLLWANARDTALGFYRDRIGMNVAVNGYLDTTTSLGHHRVWLVL